MTGVVNIFGCDMDMIRVEGRDILECGASIASVLIIGCIKIPNALELAYQYP